ncbi:MAG: SDR family oxidoreductase [Streptosporangiales bacterium]|nr:SDR family oxidoreductase [Streptosporangiales bacterium]
MDWFGERSGLGGTVAVITGGGGGLGAAIASDLAANGVRLALIDKDAAAAAAVRETLAERGRDAIVRTGDARDAAALEALFAAADERWGRVDTLVNVVGGTFRASFCDTTPKGWNAIWRTNVEHVLHACSLAAPRMRSGGRGGSIINITTIEAHRAAPGFAVYSAAKAAVEQFGRTLAVELAPDGIRVNNIAPDYVPTPSLAAIGGGDGGMSTREGLRTAIPMGRAGRVTDISGCAVFLASALSEYVTGTTLHPDGGTFASSGWFNWPGSGWANHVPGHLLSPGDH